MYLVSGSGSGLGQFLSNNLPSVRFMRNVGVDKYKDQHFKAIIHCAYNAGRDIRASDFNHYINDNFLLTKKLLSLSFDKFIFISSSDIYPTNVERIWCENDDFIVDSCNGLYAVSKLIAEGLVSSCAKNHLIIRPTAMLGLEARPNSLIKILTQPNASLTLSKDSSFNYIHYEDILSFIKSVVKRDIVGIFNASSTDNLTLGSVADELGLDVKFGKYTYQGRVISNEKIKQITPEFDKRSIDVVNRFSLTLERSKVC